jgi:ABC-type lipoprotein export system ATPase subunit
VALIARFGLADRRKHVPAALSTGERQRVGLARALINGPKLILADEPTGNLDPESAEMVLDALAEFAASGGAVLMVSHSAEACARAARLYTMRRGEIAAGPAPAAGPPQASRTSDSSPTRPQ